MDTSRDLTAYVQSTFQQIVPYADAFAARFYSFLFELDPSLRSLFKGDMIDQGRKLAQILVVVVNSIDKLEDLTSAVENLGKRHLAYGVKDTHYETVGTALILTLEDFLGEDFTPDLRNAWLQTYNLLAQVAIRGANQAVFSN